MEPVAQLEPNFDGIVIVSGNRALPPRWPPQCSCVVIESSFDPGERLQAPGSLWLVLNANFNSILVISWRSALLVEETGVPGKKHCLTCHKSLTNFIT